MESSVFPKPLEKSNDEKNKTLQKDKIMPNAVINITTDDKIAFCVNLLKDLNSYGGRNNYVFRLAATMNENGIGKDDILNYCNQFKAQDFKIQEIEQTIESALKRTAFAKYSDDNIAHYIAKKAKQSKAKHTKTNRAKPFNK